MLFKVSEHADHVPAHLMLEEELLAKVTSNDDSAYYLELIMVISPCYNTV